MNDYANLTHPLDSCSELTVSSLANIFAEFSCLSLVSYSQRFIEQQAKYISIAIFHVTRATTILFADMKHYLCA